MTRSARGRREGRQAIVLALGLALAGCTLLDPPPAPLDEERVERPAPREGSGPPCGEVRLDAPASARVGEPVDVVASLANCGNATLQLDRGLCPDEGSGFRLLVRRGLHDWHLHARDDHEAAALHDAPCERGGSSVFGLPPTRGAVEVVHTVTFRWNGTFAVDPCWPPPAPDRSACLQFAPAFSGPATLRARITAGGHEWTAERAILLEGAPAGGDPCARVDVRGEPGALEVGIVNCGAVDLTLDPAASCREPYPFRAEVLVEAEPWTLTGAGAVRDAGCGPPPRERVVPAGGAARVRLGWNGTIGCDGCGWTRAPPDGHEVRVRIAAREGGAWEARGLLPPP